MLNKNNKTVFALQTLDYIGKCMQQNGKYCGVGQTAKEMGDLAASLLATISLDFPPDKQQRFVTAFKNQFTEAYYESIKFLSEQNH